MYALQICRISFGRDSFHGCKFSVLKAFYIVYYVSTTKNGISSTELSRKLGLRQKTCWLFKQKVMKAMTSSGDFPMEGKVDVDETYVGGQDDQIMGRKKGSKKIVVVSIEKKGKGVSRMYAKVVAAASKENLKGFMKGHIKPEASVRTDQWAGYKGLEDEFPNIVREKSEKKGKNFKDLHRCIMMFKAWLRDVHHSVRHLQSYLDEYTYRFNRHQMKVGIFENLIERMVKNEPHTYKMIIS
ncbi:transposase-like protein [Mucilaginibacter sp. UYP27]